MIFTARTLSFAGPSSLHVSQAAGKSFNAASLTWQLTYFSPSTCFRFKPACPKDPLPSTFPSSYLSRMSCASSLLVSHVSLAPLGSSPFHLRSQPSPGPLPYQCLGSCHVIQMAWPSGLCDALPMTSTRDAWRRVCQSSTEVPSCNHRLERKVRGTQT